MSKPRVCMLVTSELSRDPRVQKEASIAFEHGYEVTVVCRTYEGDAPPYHVKTTEISKPESLLGKYVERLLSIVVMFWHALRTRADIIHANDLDTLPAAFAAGKLLRARIVYDSHELWPDASANLRGVAARVANGLQKFIVHRIDGVVTVNAHLAAELEERLGVPRPTVVMNAPYLRGHERLEPLPWVKLFEGKKIVLYQGRYIPGRGVWDAIEAAKFLADDVAMVFRGYGPLEEEMRERVRQEGLEEKVFFLPPAAMTDLVCAAVGADVGLVLYDPINASNRNVSPNKFFELMMAGTPMVCSDMVFLREMTSALDVGVVYHPGDPKGLAQAIASIVGDEETQARMKANCLKHRQQFCWENEGGKLLRLYDQIITKRS